MGMLSAIIDGGPTGALSLITKAATSYFKAAVKFAWGDDKAFQECALGKKEINAIRKALSEDSENF